MKSNGDASAAGGGGAQGSIAGGAQSLELPPPPNQTEQILRPKQLVVVVCVGWSQCCSVIGPGAEWGRSLSSLTPCTALRLSAEEVCTSLIG